MLPWKATLSTNKLINQWVQGPACSVCQAPPQQHAQHCPIRRGQSDQQTGHICQPPVQCNDASCKQQAIKSTPQAPAPTPAAHTEPTRTCTEHSLAYIGVGWFALNVSTHRAAAPQYGCTQSVSTYSLGKKPQPRQERRQEHTAPVV